MLTDLLSEQLGHLGVAVTQSIDGDTRSEVEVLSVLNVPQETSFSLLEHGWWANIGRDHERCRLAYQAAGLRVRLRIRGRQSRLLLFISSIRFIWFYEEIAHFDGTLESRGQV